MKKSVLYLVALCITMFSCSKNTYVPVEYSISDIQGNALQNVYIPDSGTYTLPVLVKFLQGNINDSVEIILSGLPASITVATDTISQKPTYTGNFVLNINNAAQGTYPVSIISYTKTKGYTTSTFNLVVQPPNCATLFSGAVSASNACSATNYTYTVTGTVTGSGTLTINNFGGYGSGTNTNMVFDCDNDIVTIPSQNIGNGVTLSGSGTFLGNKMVITYNASNIPTGGSDACTVTLTK